MEIYAAAKRGQTAPVRQQSTAAKGADAAVEELEAKLDQFQRAREAVSQLEAQAREAEEKIRQAAARLAYENSQKTAQEGSGELEALDEQLKMMMRCQEIARRLMAGDLVPPEDEQYLMTNDPDGYKLAMAARQPKQDPKEWESVLKDDKSPQTEESAQGEDTQTSGPAARSGDRGESEGGRAGSGDSGGG